MPGRLPSPLSHPGGHPAEGGSRYDVYGWCFRHEPSLDPARMQAFRQHDLVYVGNAEQASHTGIAGCSSAWRSSVRWAW